MKLPSSNATFGWLTAAVACATCCILAVIYIFLPLTSRAADSVGLLPVTELGPVESPTIAPESLHNPTDNLIQIAFLLDTSNSMDGLIEQAKTRLWNILNETISAKRNGQSPQVEVALYEYGNDGLGPRNGYVRQVVGLTTDVDELSEKLFGLTTNGGDEYCGTVINQSIKELDWSDQAQAVKLIYIAGNESFLQGDLDPSTPIEEGRAKGIIVNTIFCGEPNRGRNLGWYGGAMAGKGDYFHINQNEATVYVPSPYDDRIEAINLQLNDTYIPMGAQGVKAKEKQLAQDANAMKYSKSNLASRAKYKATANYCNAHWDLVDAYDKDKSIIKKRESLPDSLRALAESEIVSRIAAVKEQRNALQAEIKELNKLRDQHVAEEKQKNAAQSEATLGDRITVSVKKCLKEKGYDY
ncbi:MAG: VWA domain-containing protein [Bacteroidota bacterium]